MTLPVFPSLKGLSFPAKRTPKWSTLHQESVSGQDNPIQLWSYPRWAYELTFNILRSDNVNLEWQELAAFYNLVGGSAGVFQFTDPDDNAVTNQQFGIGDGVTQSFPLVRTMTGAGSFSFVEPVFAPTSVTAYINGVQNNGWTLGTQGMLNWIGVPPSGGVLTWTGTFNWLCRFDEDAAGFEKFMYQFWNFRSVKFTTIKTQSK